MESKPRWSWKEGFRFALCWKFQQKVPHESLPMHWLEASGYWIVKPIYQILDRVARGLRKPLVIVLFTLSIACFCAIAFYNIPIWLFLGKVFPAKLVRFLTFLYTELLCLGAGIRAFGRFHNASLVKLWKQDRLIPIFPGRAEKKDLIP